MKNDKKNDFADRRGAAADAKAARLKAHRAAREVAEPARLARQEERLAAAAAKHDRDAERERAKREEQKRIEAEVADKAAADAPVEAGAETLEEPQSDRGSPLVEDEAAKKAERDRRYANRKARKR